MAKNTGNSYRTGSVTGRTQTFNPQNNTYLKRNAENGQFMAGKTGSPFKGVAKEVDGRRS